MENPAATLELQYPIKWGKKDPELIETLEFRRMKARDLRNLPDGDGERTIVLVARLTGHPPSAIDELDGADLAAAGKIIEGFLPKSPETGEESWDGSPTG